MLMLAASLALPTAAEAAPGTPGVPQAAPTIYTENFQNRPGPTPIVKLNNYTGTTGQTYTAHSNWLTQCNGWIASANQSTTGAAQIADCGGAQNFWNQAQRLSWALGMDTGQSQAAARGNYAVSAFTAGNPWRRYSWNSRPRRIFLSSPAINTFSVDVAAATARSLRHCCSSLWSMAGRRKPVGSQINACASGTTRYAPDLDGEGALNTGTYTSNGAVLISGASFGVRMVNNNGSGTGNDHAFDNIRVLDATPQLDKLFSPTSLAVGETSTLTLTITNTAERGTKNGWSFTDSLPAGLVVTGRRRQRALRASFPLRPMDRRLPFLEISLPEWHSAR